MRRTKLRLDFTPDEHQPNETAFALFLTRWLDLARRVEKGFSFKFDWERLFWEVRLSIGKPSKKGACAMPIANLRVDLIRSDQLREDIPVLKPNSIPQAFCRDITFVSYESRLDGKIHKTVGGLAKDVIAHLEKTRN